MPISAEQWRAVVGSNNVRMPRPRQVCLKPRYFIKQRSDRDRDKLKFTPQLDQDTSDYYTTRSNGAKESSSSARTQSVTLQKGQESSTGSVVGSEQLVLAFLCEVRAQVLQAFIFVVMMKLLLLAGDVEKNPGPGADTPEYKALVSCTPLLVDALSHSVSEISDHLFSKFLISVETRDQVSNHYKTGREKASILVKAVTDSVKLKNTNFQEFISVLQSVGPWTSDLVTALMSAYQREASTGNKPSSIQPRSQDTTKRVDEIATHFRVDPGLLDVPCAPSHLLPISKLLVHWNAYTDHLGLTEQEEHDIHTNPKLTAPPHMRTLEMLKQWQKKYADSTKSHYRHLLRGCIEIQENAKLVGDICTIIAQNPAKPSSPKPKQISAQPSPTKVEEPDSKRFKPEEGSSSQEPPPSPPSNRDELLQAFCILPPTDVHVLETQSSEESMDDNVAHAQVATSKLWPSGENVLDVYFMNSIVLKQVDLNIANIMSWAEKWKRYDVIPKFRKTKDPMEANIRVKIVPDGHSWSKVGTDAKSVDVSKPTMTLGLTKGDNDYNQHIVIHEFGHALGLEHEHQRSKFWSIASKFIDIGPGSKMKADLQGFDVEGSYLAVTQQGSGSEEYDPDSVMHYWFDVGWLKDPKHHKLQGVNSDPKITEDERKVLQGIHKRHRKLAKEPSQTDYNFLADCYRSDASSSKGTGTTVEKGEGVSSKLPDTGHNGPQAQLVTNSSNIGEQQSAQIGGHNANNSCDAAMEIDGLADIERDGSKESRTASNIEQIIQNVSVMANEMDRPDTVEQLKAISDSMKSNCLKVGVIGTTNSGKSTTLNALLGGKYLPTSHRGNTAYVLCIKQTRDPQSCGELYDIAGHRKLIASGREDICRQLSEFNKIRRSVSDSATKTSKRQLELHVPLPDLAHNDDVNLEMYDTPGTSENKHLYADIHGEAKQAREDIHGIILVLDTDSIQSQAAADLLTDLNERFPLLMKRKGDKRVLVLVNKYDRLFENNQSLEEADEECQEIKKAVPVPSEEIMFYSAELGFVAKIWEAGPSSVDEDHYQEVLLKIQKFPDQKEATKRLKQKSRNEKVVRELGAIVKRGSRIVQVEERLMKSCLKFRVIKAIDDTKNQVTELKNHAQQQIEFQETLKSRFETVKRCFIEEFPRDVKEKVEDHLQTLAKTLVEHVKGKAQKQANTLEEESEDKAIATQQISNMCDFLIKIATIKLTSSFETFMKEFQKALKSESKRHFEGLCPTEAKHAVNSLQNLIDSLEKIKMPVEDVKTHESVSQVLLQAHISQKKQDDKANALKKSFNTFASYCEHFFQTEVQVVIKRETNSIAREAAEKVLNFLQHPDTQLWLDDGETQARRCDDQIRQWRQKVDLLVENDKMLEHL